MTITKTQNGTALEIALEGRLDTMTAPELEAYLTGSLNRIFKKPFSFEFEWMQVIPPDPNGKLRMIVCEVG